MDYEKQTDEELIRGLRSGDSKIMDYLLAKYKPLVLKKARAMYLLGGENEDLIQEGMIGLFKAVRDYREEEKASFYSFAGLCISRQMYSAVESANRKKHMPLNSYVSLYENNQAENKKAPPLIDLIPGDAQNDPEVQFLGKEYSELFQEQLWEQLSPLETKVLVLHLQGSNYRAIAERIDRSPKTVDNALQRIRFKAGKLLDGQKES